ncbi:MBOAT family O-acyltransferase [Gehongia tenuis]|uniref:MBOAT family protein n=1 Tax=Gehongia tenuis TaxID=2763655 RepID=A0A926D3C8_9FIRM|nr:MBOAT family O-acyltransferase [Gehongia tenuis]MBC8530724.1 MBOAT family protein [Gehongia tenuis]
MSITSLTFFVLLPIALIVYYILPARIRWCFLALLSAAFVYLSSGISMLLVLCAEVFVVWCGSYLIQRVKGAALRRLCLVAFLVATLGTLFFFRDMEFFNLLKKLYHAISGNDVTLIAYAVWGPIGISYFTLSLVGYLIDVYWEKYPYARNYFRLFLVASYFPQLTSGPIVNYDSMEPQFRSPPPFDPKRVLHGAERILWGCFQKMVLADRAGIFVGALFDAPENYAGLFWVVAILLYAFQLYNDFAGCMNIVLGVSECFGITLPENFNVPFASLSLSEFWRRWHITMGLWFKTYVMYPLLKSGFMQRFTKKSKKHLGKVYGKKLPVCLGMSALWISIGLWHGGSATFILASGLIPGFFIISGELLSPLLKRLTNLLHIRVDCFSYRLFCRIRTLLAMCCSWIFVRAGSVSGGIDVFSRMFSGGINPWIFTDGSLLNMGLDIYDFFILAVGFLVLVCVGILHEQGKQLRNALSRQNIVFQYLVLLTGIFVVLIFGIYGPGYNEAGFIYKQF